MTIVSLVPTSLPRWRGDYNEHKQKWFPSNYVEEIIGANDTQAPLGNMQQGSIDICRCSVGKWKELCVQKQLGAGESGKEGGKGWGDCTLSLTEGCIRRKSHISWTYLKVMKFRL